MTPFGGKGRLIHMSQRITLLNVWASTVMLATDRIQRVEGVHEKGDLDFV